MSLNETLLKIEQSINRYICPTLLILDIMGCILNILLFSHKQFRTISCCTYFLGASISMIIVIILGFVPNIYAVNHPNPIHRNSFVCKIRNYAGQSSYMISRWLITMACIDRCMISSTNVRLREYTKPHRAHCILRRILLICILLPLHNLIFLDVKRNWCTHTTYAYLLYHSIVTFIFGSFLPLLIMIISIIRLGENLASKGVRRRRYYISEQSEGQTNRLVRKRDHQVLLMLFIQVLFYILTTTPWMIFLLYSTHTRQMKNKSMNRILTESFARYLTEIILCTYPTLSFYIYTLTSKTFRAELFHIICTLFTRKKRFRYDRSPKLYRSTSTQMRTFLPSSSTE